MIKQTRSVLVLPMVLAALLTGGLGQKAGAQPWTRGYVVGTYEIAFHYGGRAGFTRPGQVEPGSNCPHGSTVHLASSERVRQALNRQLWRDSHDIIVTPPGMDKVPGTATLRLNIWGRAVSNRGWKKGIGTYVNLFAADDTGQPEVMGKISHGLNLDGNPQTGFTSPDGQRGVDNNLYRSHETGTHFRRSSQLGVFPADAGSSAL